MRGEGNRRTARKKRLCEEGEKKEKKRENYCVRDGGKDGWRVEREREEGKKIIALRNHGTREFSRKERNN